jgi:hypothetical protein
MNAKFVLMALTFIATAIHDRFTRRRLLFFQSAKESNFKNRPTYMIRVIHIENTAALLRFRGRSGPSTRGDLFFGIVGFEGGSAE